MTRKRIFFNIGLVFIGSIICIILGLLFFVRTLGYSVDIKNKRLVERGGIKVSSTPSSALISLDSKKTSIDTEANILNLKVGSHKLSLNKDKYRSWDKIFEIRAKEMNFLDTAYLIPNDFILTPAWDYTDIKDIHCLEQKSVCFFTMTANDTLMRLDYNEKDFKLTKINIDYKLLENTDSPFALEFNIKDDLYLGGDLIWFRLKKHGSDKDNIIVYNYASDQSYNLNKQHLIESGQLYRLDNNKVYILDQGKLRLISLRESSISTVIAENIVDFRLINNEYIFISNNQGQYSAMRLSGEEKVDRIFNLIEYSPGSSIYMYTSSINGKQYYVFDQERGDVYEYRSFEGTTPTSIKKIFNNIKNISFSKDYRRIVAINDMGQLQSYNCEYLIKNNNFITLPANYQIKSWVNLNTLLLIDNGQYGFMDYDGQNKYNFAGLNTSDQLYQFKKRKYLIIKKQDNYSSFYIVDLDNINK